MKIETRYIISELKQKQYLDQIYKAKIIDLDKYFPNSSKIEEGKRFKPLHKSNYYKGLSFS